MGKRTALAQVEPEVREAFDQCERTIESALSDAHHALRKIHDDKLYKVAGFTSFESYCTERWGYSKTHAYRLIDHAKLVDHLKAEGAATVPATERVARPLLNLRRSSKNDEHYKQRVSEAWQIANDTAPKIFDVPQITESHVISTMAQYGLYRNAKKKVEDPDAIELRDRLTKLFQCEAFKSKPKEFVNKSGGKAFPGVFMEKMAWLQDAMEQLAINEPPF